MAHCVTKLCQLDPTLCNFSRSDLRRHVWQIFCCYKTADQVVTHFAQKCQNFSGMIEGWTEYIQQKMLIAGVPLSKVTNFDQTNVMLCTESKQSIAHKGSKIASALKGMLLNAAQ
jgi:hypothetical protein